jgi:hypothetical protein
MFLLDAPVFMWFFGVGSHKKPSGLIMWIIVIGALVVCLAAAYGFSILTEAKTGQNPPMDIWQAARATEADKAPFCRISHSQFELWASRIVRLGALWRLFKSVGAPKK